MQLWTIDTESCIEDPVNNIEVTANPFYCTSLYIEHNMSPQCWANCFRWLRCCGSFLPPSAPFWWSVTKPFAGCLPQRRCCQDHGENTPLLLQTPKSKATIKTAWHSPEKVAGICSAYSQLTSRQSRPLAFMSLRSGSQTWIASSFVDAAGFQGQEWPQQANKSTQSPSTKHNVEFKV